MLDRWSDGTVDGDARIQRILDDIGVCGVQPDALMFTGDLADRGQADAYAKLRRFVELPSRRHSTHRTSGPWATMTTVPPSGSASRSCAAWGSCTAGRGRGSFPADLVVVGQPVATAHHRRRLLGARDVAGARDDGTAHARASRGCATRVNCMTSM